MKERLNIRVPNAEARRIVRENRKYGVPETMFETDKFIQVNKHLDVYKYAVPTPKTLYHALTAFIGVTKIWLTPFRPVYLILYDESFEKAPDKVKEFAIYHEVGHVSNEDLEESGTKIKRENWLRNFGKLPQCEVEADKYAVAMLGEDYAKAFYDFIINNTNLGIIGKIEIMRRRKAILG